MRAALQAIVPHMYGNHGKCGTWCKFMAGDATHHRNISCDLHDTDLKLSLENILAPYITNAQKWMTTASSQTNEALKHFAWSKTPTVRNYSHSESFDFRVSAAVLQFNDGLSYITDVTKNCNLSPNKETEKHIVVQDRIRDKQKMYKQNREAKRRSFELKKLRLLKSAVSEIKEGVSYQSCCAFDELEVLDTTPLPEPAVKYEQCHPECPIVYYDLVTSNVGDHAEIVQLSAVCGDSHFTKFVLPKGDIHVKATAVNGLEVRIVKEKKYLFQDNQEVESCDVSMAFSEFLAWLNSLSDGKVILAAHNGKVFDMKFLLKYVTETNCFNLFCKNVYGFIDTLPLLRKLKPRMKSYKLTNLYEQTFGVTFEAHDALHDAKALQYIIKDRSIAFKEMESYILTATEAVNYLLNRRHSRACAAEMENELCKNEKVITCSMAKKISESGLSYDHLKTAYLRDPENGIKLLLSEQVNGKPRVTN
ncbi:uncharacterized protein LOC128551445 [Mercenaria mercenaria]|uniref:uncharacterized protein LOC128551445 n=1 Tax=Mercenaria mercenaria TaxID=6596 RepID=UPI00234EE526|nr:uncharacterized protein LOC128551445 [Mercenaria mercenaria]